MSTPTPAPSCHRCGAPLPAGRPSRRDACASCRSDVRVCRNCAFHEPGAANDCREPSAERVADKERANFCDYFALVVAPAGRAPGATSGGAREAHEALHALFRKP
jgi:hypothetical protein